MTRKELRLWELWSDAISVDNTIWLTELLILDDAFTLSDTILLWTRSL